MKQTNRARRYAGTFLTLVAGAGAVVGGAYLVSRIKEKQDTETRLERMEQMVEELAGAGKGGAEAKGQG